MSGESEKEKAAAPSPRKSSRSSLLMGGGKLVVNQFEGPFPALGLSLKKVQFHLRQLGCAMAKSKADADKGATIATLKLPLAFPKESRGAPAARR